jgi:hypothetical protein
MFQFTACQKAILYTVYGWLWILLIVNVAHESVYVETMWNVDVTMD